MSSIHKPLLTFLHIPIICIVCCKKTFSTTPLIFNSTLYTLLCTTSPDIKPPNGQSNTTRISIGIHFRTKQQIGHFLTFFEWPVFSNKLSTPDRKSTRLNSSHVAISYAV